MTNLKEQIELLDYLFGIEDESKNYDEIGNDITKTLNDESTSNDKRKIINPN